jgi:hypothetical protein
MTTDKEILFAERQKFKQWWLWIFFILINALFLYAVYQQIILGKPFGNNPMSDTEHLVVTGLTIVFTLLFGTFRLDTLIKKDGIYVRFFPIHIKFKHYSWDSLTKSFVRQYSPLTEYGGWGIRSGFSGKNTALNISGDKGLQLEFTNNKKLLIGTNKPEELTEILKNIGQLKK